MDGYFIYLLVLRTNLICLGQTNSSCGKFPREVFPKFPTEVSPSCWFPWVLFPPCSRPWCPWGLIRSNLVSRSSHRPSQKLASWNGTWCQYFSASLSVRTVWYQQVAQKDKFSHCLKNQKEKYILWFGKDKSKIKSSHCLKNQNQKYMIEWK